MSIDEKQMRQKMRETAVGQLLVRSGFEPYGAEESARRVAECAAIEIERLRKRICELESALGSTGGAAAELAARAEERDARGSAEIFLRNLDHAISAYGYSADDPQGVRDATIAAVYVVRDAYASAFVTGRKAKVHTTAGQAG